MSLPAGSMAARSFKPRRRQLSAARAARLEPAMALVGLSVDGTELVLPDLFGSSGPFALDIGFGAGEALIDLARCRPHECVIGVDVHTTGLAAVVETARAKGWEHVRVVDGDVLDLLPRFGGGTLDEVRAFFPDPWPKRRQRHRRLIRLDVVTQLVDRLRVGGRLHLATDDPDYAAQMQQACAADDRLVGRCRVPPGVAPGDALRATRDRAGPRAPRPDLRAPALTRSAELRAAPRPQVRVPRASPSPTCTPESHVQARVAGARFRAPLTRTPAPPIFPRQRRLGRARGTRTCASDACAAAEAEGPRRERHTVGGRDRGSIHT